MKKKKRKKHVGIMENEKEKEKKNEVGGMKMGREMEGHHRRRVVDG